MQLAVLVSGVGTILEAMIAAEVPIALVAADRPCRGLDIAEAAGLPAELVERDTFAPDFDRAGYSKEMARFLQERDIDVVAMAGFGTILSGPMHAVYGGRLLNTHPSLLPSFPGWNAVRDAIDHGVKVTGCTIHLAGLEADTGPILAQEPVPVLDDDTVETLQERIKEVERVLYPQTLHRILERGSIQP